MQAPDGFERFAYDYAPVLRRIAWLMTGDWQAAEDAAQDALARTWLYWRRIRDDEARTAYARKTLIREVARVRRLRRSAESPTEDLGLDSAASKDAGINVDLLMAIRSLPPRQRAVIAFRYLEDLSERETAAALGCSAGTVKSQTNKALKALRQHPFLAEPAERKSMC